MITDLGELVPLPAAGPGFDKYTPYVPARRCRPCEVETKEELCFVCGEETTAL